MPMFWDDNMSADNFNGGALYTQSGNPVVVAHGMMVEPHGSTTWFDQRTPVVFPNLTQSITTVGVQSHTLQWMDIGANNGFLLQIDALATTMHLVMLIGGLNVLYLTKTFTVPLPGPYTISLSLDYTGLYRGAGSDGQFIQSIISLAHMRYMASLTLYPGAN